MWSIAKGRNLLKNRFFFGALRFVSWLAFGSLEMTSYGVFDKADSEVRT